MGINFSYYNLHKLHIFRLHLVSSATPDALTIVGVDFSAAALTDNWRGADKGCRAVLGPNGVGYLTTTITKLMPCTALMIHSSLYILFPLLLHHGEGEVGHVAAYTIKVERWTVSWHRIKKILPRFLLRPFPFHGDSFLAWVMGNFHLLRLTP